MGLFDDIIINEKYLTCLSQEEKDILAKGDDCCHFQTKDLENTLTCFEILEDKIFELRGNMNHFRADISNYCIEIYDYFNLDDGKIVDCEIILHIKDGIVQEMKKKKFEVKEPEVFKFPEYEYKRGYHTLMLLTDVFLGISNFFRKYALKRKTIKKIEE